MVQVSSDSAAELASICDGLLEARLAACAQIHGPITSRYWWQGKIEESAEWVATLKTTRAMVAPATEAIAAAHHYEVPEILVLEAVASPAYGAWVAQEVGRRPASSD